jgi:hypothetical protein
MSEDFPRPVPPSPQEVIKEEQTIKVLSALVPPLIFGGLMTVLLLIALAASYNFNIFYWLE